MIWLGVIAVVLGGGCAACLVGAAHLHILAMRRLTVMVAQLALAVNRATAVQMESITTAKAQIEMNRQLVESVKSRPPGARAN